MIFTDDNVEKLEPRDKGYKLFDRSRTGLHLYVSPTGAKSWRVRYWLYGQARIYSLGMYPVVNVRTAKKLTIEAKRKVAQGIDPVRERQDRRVKVKQQRLHWKNQLIIRGDSETNLTNRAIQKLKPKAKGYSLWDRHRTGLHLFVSPQGGKLWRLRYSINGKPKVISIGRFEYFNVKEAREEAYNLRRLISRGVDPLFERSSAREAKQAVENTFSRVAAEWFDKVSGQWSDGYRTDVLRRLEIDLNPAIGNRPINEIKPIELLRVIRSIEERCVGAAHRALQVCGPVFRYAVCAGLAESDPSASLKGALAPVNRGHFAAITTPSEVGELLRRIDKYEGSTVVKCALRLLPYVFVRPGELRGAEWSEINFEACEWRIPAIKMKKRDAHVVPLSKQAIAILEEVKTVTGDNRFVFLSEQRHRGHRSPISENALVRALRHIGYDKNTMCPHGFRSTASSLLNELGHRPDLVELQLAHKERGIMSIYHHSNHIGARREMMQSWADYLDDLRGGSATKKRVAPVKDATTQTSNTVDNIDNIIDNIIREALND